MRKPKKHIHRHMQICWKARNKMEKHLIDSFRFDEKDGRFRELELFERDDGIRILQIGEYKEYDYSGVYNEWILVGEHLYDFQWCGDCGEEPADDDSDYCEYCNKAIEEERRFNEMVEKLAKAWEE